MQIFVKTLAGKTITLSVDPADEIASVETRVQDKEAISTDHSASFFFSECELHVLMQRCVSVRPSTFDPLGVQNSNLCKANKTGRVKPW